MKHLVFLLMIIWFSAFELIASQGDWAGRAQQPTTSRAKNYAYLPFGDIVDQYGHDSALEIIEQAYFKELNAYRVETHKTRLRPCPHLRTIAQEHANCLAENMYIGHTGLDGRTPGQRAKDKNISYNQIGENISYTSGSVIYCVNAFKSERAKQTGHHRIFHHQFYKLGIGISTLKNGNFMVVFVYSA